MNPNYVDTNKIKYPHGHYKGSNAYRCIIIQSNMQVGTYTAETLVQLTINF